jgi:hypothetical protein
MTYVRQNRTIHRRDRDQIRGQTADPSDSETQPDHQNERATRLLVAEALEANHERTQLLVADALEGNQRPLVADILD